MVAHRDDYIDICVYRERVALRRGNDDSVLVVGAQ